jgi:hypothetical protein
MKASLAENIKAIEVKKRIPGARVGTIVDITDEGQVRVDFPGNTCGPTLARFAGSVREKVKSATETVPQNILLIFENEDPELPIIVDVICDSTNETGENDPIALQVDKPEDVFVDGKRITFDAKEEIVLRCGKSSITLTRAGKVLIRGAYLLTRSSGVNRIKGASVQIN